MQWQQQVGKQTQVPPVWPEAAVALERARAKAERTTNGTTALQDDKLEVEEDGPKGGQVQEREDDGGMGA